MTACLKKEDLGITQSWTVDKHGQTLETNKWHILPTYRLELTLFHAARSQQPSRKTTVIKNDYESWDSANEAALQLAKNCRSSGESVMLVKRKEGDVDVLHQYVVGTWNWKDDWSGRVPCKWSLIHDWERDRWYSHRKGDISGYVNVVRWWEGLISSPCERVELGVLQKSEDGNPPPGVPYKSLYRFAGYRLRNSRAWQPVITVTPLSWLRPDELASLSSMIHTHTLRQHPPGAWRTQNLCSVITGLGRNIVSIRLACREPRDLKVRFDFRKTRLENPTDIVWRLSKKSVVAKDLKIFELKLRLLKLQRANHAVVNLPSIRPSAGRSKTINDLKRELHNLEEWELECADDDLTSENPHVSSQIQTDRDSTHVQLNTEPLFSSGAAHLMVLVALLQDCLTRFWEALRGLFVVVLMLPRRVEGPVNADKLSDPGICSCTVHQWRRASFPRHKRLPAVRKRDDSNKISVPDWAQDSTHVPRHFQHFIPEPELRPEPETLRGYIRRQLETGWPVPRQKYIDFGVMIELDCRTRWGSDWRLQSEREQNEWDGYRNVKKQQRKVRAPKTGDPPHDELYGYDGCILEHETRCKTPNRLEDAESGTRLWQ